MTGSVDQAETVFNELFTSTPTATLEDLPRAEWIGKLPPFTGEQFPDESTYGDIFCAPTVLGEKVKSAMGAGQLGWPQKLTVEAALVSTLKPRLNGRQPAREVTVGDLRQLGFNEIIQFDNTTLETAQIVKQLFPSP